MMVHRWGHLPRRKIVSVQIAGKKFRQEDGRRVSSQDHYVEITTENEKVLLRGRLVDVTNQLTGVDGITPHRSHWVARRAVVSISSKSGGKTLLLTDETEIPIARARIGDVQKWIES